ncbi:response regulator [Candidatus Kaiserbacteria bacterium]|nr:response regulator [Candidatus Kaiserbacteria bacterium]
MSVLTNKRVLFVGNPNHQVDSLISELEARGVEVSKHECSTISTDLVSDDKIDLIILNHEHADDVCSGAQTLLTNKEVAPIPLFAVVRDNPDDIQKVLSEGATDYIIPTESVDSIIQKIEAVFDEGDIFSGSASIDISPLKADVSATGIRVYVVEDDPLLRNLLSIRLDKSSFPFEFSKDGNDIVPILKQFKPDVIILDLMLPGKSGFDVLAELKSDEYTKDVPVIVFSNRDGAGDRTRAKELGASSFYVKAMTDLSELVETIETIAKK